MDRRDFLASARPSRMAEAGKAVRRAFAEFLTVPTLIIAAFLAAAAVTYALDHVASGPAGPFRRYMEEHFFRNARATSDLLGTVATGLITIVSITFSLLLLAVQQSAAALTNQVFDQFLRRRFNQFFFGFFVGLTLYALIILTTVDPPYNPIYGATLALALMGFALFLLIVLLYTTIDQMRPAAIVDAIHGHTLAARARHGEFLRGVSPSPAGGGPVRTPVRAAEHGYVVRIDARRLSDAARVRGGVEVVLRVSVGSFVGFRDEIAEIRSDMDAGVEGLDHVVRESVVLERQRDLDHDPAFGIEQLHTIAWTSVSTAKSNPYPGLLVIRSLRDILARWCDEEGFETPGAAESGGTSLVVYSDDVPGQVMDALESLAIIASESMQHLTLAEVYRNIVTIYDRLTPPLRRRAEDLVLRSLSSLGDHVLTSELDEALRGLAGELAAGGRADSAAAVEKAREGLERSVGKLNSRGTRARGGR